MATARASIEEVAEIVHLQPEQTNNTSSTTSVLNERPTVFTGAINSDLGDAASLMSLKLNQSSSSGFLSRSGNLNLAQVASTTISSVNNELDDDTTNFRQHYLKEEDENNPATQNEIRLSHIRNRRQKERDQEEAREFDHQQNQQQQTEAEDVDLRIKLISKQNKVGASTMTAAATVTKSDNKRYSSASAGAERTTETNEMNDMISFAGKHSSDWK